MLASDIIGPGLTTLTEKVIGGLAIGYHRTRNLKNVNAIGESGFKAGSGAMYGTGIYLTYDFDDQQDDYMREHYGPYVVRCKVALHGYLIFDEAVATAVYGRRSSLRDQFKLFGLSDDLLQHIEKQMIGRVYSSVAARDFANTIHGKKQQGKIKGIVFTGENDGRVIVAYDPSTVKSLGYARVIDDNKTLEKVKWRRFETATAGQALPPVRLTPAQQFYRAMKRFGFTPVAHGVGGARLVGKVNGRFVTVKIKTESWSDSVTVSAYMTQKDPEALEKRLPGVVEKHGVRLFWQSYRVADQAIPYSAIVQSIVSQTAGFDEVRDTTAQVWEAMMQMLVAPGTSVHAKRDEGMEYSQEKLTVTADGVSLLVTNLADQSMRGKLNIASVPPMTQGVTVKPINFEGEATPEVAYNRLLDCLRMTQDMYGDRRKMPVPKLPDTLSTRFRTDLTAILGGT